ncbi:hypothetical protein BC567DRAFT_265997 [Phyllosticta citribraziliensis]
MAPPFPKTSVNYKAYMEEFSRLCNENTRLLEAVDQYKNAMADRIQKGKAAQSSLTLSPMEREELMAKGKAAEEEYNKAVKDREGLLKSRAELEALIAEHSK